MVSLVCHVVCLQAPKNNIFKEEWKLKYPWARVHVDMKKPDVVMASCTTCFEVTGELHLMQCRDQNLAKHQVCM